MLLIYKNNYPFYTLCAIRGVILHLNEHDKKRPLGLSGQRHSENLSSRRHDGASLEKRGNLPAGFRAAFAARRLGVSGSGVARLAAAQGPSGVPGGLGTVHACGTGLPPDGRPDRRLSGREPWPES